MNLKQVEKIRWIFAGFLGLSLVCIFLPYDQISPFHMLKSIFLHGGDNEKLAVPLIVIGYILPVILTFVSGVIMTLRPSWPKCLACTILNIIALEVYVFFKTPFLTVPDSREAIGFIGSVVIASIGTLLPLIEFMLYNAAVKKDKAADNMPSNDKALSFTNVKIIKWIFAGFLGLSLVFLFTPYIYQKWTFPDSKIYIEKIDILEYVRLLFTEGYTGIYSSVLLGIVFPVLLTVISAFVMAFKTNFRKSIACMVLNLLALNLYIFFCYLSFDFNQYFLVTNILGIGFIANALIPGIGVLMAVVELQLNRKVGEEKLKAGEV